MCNSVLKGVGDSTGIILCAPHPPELITIPPTHTSDANLRGVDARMTAVSKVTALSVLPTVCTRRCRVVSLVLLPSLPWSLLNWLVAALHNTSTTTDQKSRFPILVSRDWLLWAKTLQKKTNIDRSRKCWC